MTSENILNYATSGDLASLKKHAVEVKKSVHTCSPDGRTFLIAACTNGHHDVAEYLIDVHNADVLQVGTLDLNGEIVEGVPPLWCASATGNLKLVELLVSRGADVNQTTSLNSTALRAACFGGHEEVVKFLIEHGADVEIANCHGHTCLMISCYRRQDRIVEYLLKNNARVNRQSDKGSTALHDCAEIGYIKGIELLLQYGAIMKTDENGQSPIICAANAGSKKVVDYLANLITDVKEKASAYYILGASFFDRHHSVPDALAAWNHAMTLLQNSEDSTEDSISLELTKPLLSNSIWSKLAPAACHAVTQMELQSGNGNLDPQVQCAACSRLNSCYCSPSHFVQCSEQQSSVYLQKENNLYAYLNSSRMRQTKCNQDDTVQHLQCSEVSNSLTVVDTILGLEPLVECPSSFRRFSVSSQDSSFCCPTRNRKLESKLCPSCQNVVLPFGTKSDINQCPNCHRILSRDDEYNLRSRKRKTSVQQHGHCTSKALCFCCHEVTEQHPLIQRFQTYTTEAFNRIPQFSTPQQLDELTRDPQALCLQPLLIRLRLLGPGHPEVNRFIRDAIYTNTSNLGQCLKIWRFVITCQHIFSNPLGSTSQTAFASLAEVFLNILTETCSAIPAADLDPALIVDCLELAVDNLQWAMEYSSCDIHSRLAWSHTVTNKDASDLTRNVTMCLNLIAMLLTHYSPQSARLPNLHTHSSLSKPSNFVLKPNQARFNLDELIGDERPLGSVNSHLSLLSASSSRLSFDSVDMSSRFEGRMSPELCDRFFLQVFRLVRLNPQSNHGLSLVHLACSPETSTVGRFEMCHFPRVDVLNLLLKLGADPNLTDVDRQRPVSYILSHPYLKQSDRISLLQTLVHNGAHLDVSNPTGISILDIRCRSLVQESQICLLNHISLACLAARVAKQNGLTRQHALVRQHLSKDLLDFVDMH